MKCRSCAREFEASTKRGRPTQFCPDCRSADKHRHLSRANRHPMMFVSVDSEGHHDGHEMRLLTLSIGREDGTSATFAPDQTEGHTANVRAALYWLMDQLTPLHEGHKQVPVAFFFDYDSSVLLRGFDASTMMLIRKQGAQLETALCAGNHKGDAPCSVKRYEGGLLHRFDHGDIDVVMGEGGDGDVIAWDTESLLAVAATPRRRFYMEHRPHGDRMEARTVIDIHDTGAAFGGSLLATIARWNPALTDEQRAIIEWGKAQRADFAGASLADITAYSEAECVAHARCCRLLIDAMTKATGVFIRPDRLYGAGSIANAVLKSQTVPTREDSDLDHENVADLSYFGGMIETPLIGLVPLIIETTDIASAYPDKMRHIPCWRKGCGQWKYVRTEPREHTGYALASWDITADGTSTPPFIVRRKDGAIAQPLTGLDVWVSLPEYRAAVARFPGAIVATKWLVWRPDCQCGREYPLQFVETFYAQRQALKQQIKTLDYDSDAYWEAQAHQEAIKLGPLNSTYGKFAQRRPKFGMFTNLHVAAMITGATRAQVRQESWRREAAGDIIVYQHTDSVKSVGGHAADQGNGLGAWSLEDNIDGFVILQPGLAVAMDGGKSATRGVDKKTFPTTCIEWARGVDFTQHPTTWPSVELDKTQMISRKLAVSRGKGELAGSFLTGPTTISVRTRKRDFEGAIPCPGIPTAWKLPPVLAVHDPATESDLRVYQSQLERRKHDGADDEWLS